MAAIEANILIQGKDKNGNVILHYPITLGENIVVSDALKNAAGTEGDTIEDVLIALANALTSGVSPSASSVIITHDTTGEKFRLGLDDKGIYTVKQE